jgi:hypothetical protein
MWDLWWTKWLALGQISPSISVSAASFHSTDFSTFTDHSITILAIQS